MTPHELVEQHTIFASVVGSRAYGLAGPESDTDRRGIFLAPTALFWALDKPPPHVEGPHEEQFSWELERFCELALQANPTVLECLWSPIVEHITATGHELIAVRQAFLSQRLAQSYGNYAKDQLQRLEDALRKTGQVKWKQAMHMVRLLIAGAGVLGTHQIVVDMSEHREALLAVKRGERSWAEVRLWAFTLEAELTRAAQATTLPIEPDRATISALLTRTRRANI